MYFFEGNNLFRVYSCLLVWNKTCNIDNVHFFALTDLSKVFALYEK